MTLVAAGLAAGLAGGLLLTQYLSTLLFRVNARDPVVFGVSAATARAGIDFGVLAARAPRFASGPAHGIAQRVTQL